MVDPHLLTQCSSTTRTGKRCKHYAAVGDTKCWQHGGIKTQPNREPCTCNAYVFPHKPNAGYCRYPEPPIWRMDDDRKDRHRLTRWERRQASQWRAILRAERG